MFAVDEGPLESGGCQDAWDFRGTEVAEVGAKLDAALAKGLFNGVNSHLFDISAVPAVVGWIGLFWVVEPIEEQWPLGYVLRS